MSARRKLRVAALLLALGLGAWFLARRSGSEPAPRAPGPPTVVLVVWDSVAREELAPWGGPAAGAPRLAELARESVVFEQHVPSSNGTNAAMASLLTGLEPRHHGVGRLDAPGAGRLPDGVPLLAERFAEAGFRCVASVALPQLAPEFSGLARGFERFGAPNLDPLELLRPADRALGALRDELAPLIETREPVFVLLHLADARAPARDRPPGAERFVAERLQPFRSKMREVDAAYALFDTKPDDALAQLARDLMRRRGDAARLAFVRALYEARVAWMDAALGELVAMLRASGRWDEAVVAFCGARAEIREPSADADPSPGLVAPLLLRLPGSKWRARCDAITRDVDLAPTLCAAAGLPVPEGLDGDDLTALLLGEAARTHVRDAAFLEGDRFERRVAVGRALALERSLANGEREIVLAQTEGADPARELPDLRALLDARPPLGRVRLAWTGEGERPNLVARAPDGELAPPVREGDEDPGGRVASSQALALAGSPVELRAAEWRPDLAFSLSGAQGVDERSVRVGGRSLAELDLGLIADAGAPERAKSGENAPPPARVRLQTQGGGWSSVVVGLEPGAEARAVVELLPFALDSTAKLVDPEAGARVEPHPTRPGALVVRGKAPLSFRVGRKPTSEIACAFFLDGERVPQSAIEVDGREFAAPGGIAFALTAGAWCDPALYTAPAPDAERAGGLRIELLEPAPASAPALVAPERIDLLRTLAATE